VISNKTVPASSHGPIPPAPAVEPLHAPDAPRLDRRVVEEPPQVGRQLIRRGVTVAWLALVGLRIVNWIERSSRRYSGANTSAGSSALGPSRPKTTSASARKRVSSVTYCAGRFVRSLNHTTARSKRARA